MHADVRLPSLRVRHARQDVTQTNMRDFLCTQKLFKELDCLHSESVGPRVKKSRRVKHGVRCILSDAHMGKDLTSSSTQQQFIHHQVRLARVELLDMLCTKFGLPQTRDSYSKLECLDWVFGQKLVMPNGFTYWATDTSYMGNSISQRRDIFLLQGTEPVSTRLPGGGVRIQDTALSCEAVVFVEIRGIDQLTENTGRQLPKNVEEDVHGGHMITFILGRWLSAHPSSLERDSLCRPICPGPLRYNHCLWTYAPTSRPRRMMVNDAGLPTGSFRDCRDMFGQTERIQTQRWNDEKNAYYTLVSTSSILTTSHICKEDTHHTQEVVWLETVTVV